MGLAAQRRRAREVELVRSVLCCLRGSSSLGVPRRRLSLFRCWAAGRRARGLQGGRVCDQSCRREASFA
eukprot:2720145-Alexandrium_andersonii.AAC.1